VSTFYCFDKLNSEPDDARKVEATSDHAAAIKYAERVWEQGDYPLEMEIGVRHEGDSTSQFRVFHVEARQEWSFHVTKDE
jgi:hypothetical protein